MAVDFRAFHALPVTSFTASVLGVWFLILSLVVIRTRRAKAIAYGDGGDKLMGRRIRAHGNFAEYTPMFLLTLFIAEYQGVVRTIYLALASAVFISGRFIHGRTFMSNRLSVMGRLGGMFLTLVPLAALVAANLAINGAPVLISGYSLLRQELKVVNSDVAFLIRESFNMRKHLTTLLRHLIHALSGGEDGVK